MRKLKWSINQYRNIKGVRYEMYTADTSTFKECIIEAKSKYLKYRIIDGQFYMEVISDIKEHAQKIANINSMPYCWEDIMQRLQNNIELPFKH